MNMVFETWRLCLIFRRMTARETFSRRKESGRQFSARQIYPAHTLRSRLAKIRGALREPRIRSFHLELLVYDVTHGYAVHYENLVCPQN